MHRKPVNKRGLPKSAASERKPNRKDPRFGLKDVYVMPRNDFERAVTAAVWGDSPADFARIVELEEADRQRRNTRVFGRKIGRRI